MEDNLIDKADTIQKKKEAGYETIFGTFRTQVKWKNVAGMTSLHLLSVALLLSFPYQRHWKLLIFQYMYAYFSGFAITAGAHRLWTHRSYKATVPLKIILVMGFCAAVQNSLFDWVRNHRVHHKHSETDADPHNYNRGFFFAHIGWLVMKKHPDVKIKGQTVDMTDILEDPVVQFQQRFYTPIAVLSGFFLPTIIPILFLGENWFWSMAFNIVRIFLLLHMTWLTNSLAHSWGYRPYDKKIAPTEVPGAFLVTNGELWHNYHHTFPWDYKAAEIKIWPHNSTAFWIDQFAKLGWAYDLKEASKDLVERAKINHGDGSHPHY